MPNLDEAIKHLRRPYMSGIERSEERVSDTHEFFTPTDLLIKINDWLDNYDNSIFSDPTKTFIDHSCGDGQILSEVLIRKLQNGIDLATALSTIYGVDIMQDNVDLCRERLLCGHEDLRSIVEQNIQCRNALTFGYNFVPMGVARRNTEEKARIKQQRLKLKQEKQARIEEIQKKREAREKKLFGTTLA